MKTYKFNLLQITSLCGLSFFLFFSCNTANKAKEAANNISSLKDMAENITKNAEKMNDKIAERKASGDTLAIPYKDLQKYLPSISGFEADGSPKGESVNMAGMSFSTTNQNYKNGTESIKVSVTDYNSAYSIFTGVTAMMGAGFSIDNDDETARGVSMGMDNVKGYETIRKKSKNATLVLAIAERFLVSIEGSDMDNTNKLQEVAKQMNLAELAKK
jgi:hypothetical protein